MGSEGSDGEGEVPGQGGDDVALLSKEAQHKVLLVLRPSVDPGVQQPAGNVLILQHNTVTTATTLSPWQQHRGRYRKEEWECNAR